MRQRLGKLKFLQMGVLFAPTLFLLLKHSFRISNFDSFNDLPYKDAVNWANCSKSLALLGSYPIGDTGSWCLRRPIFAEVNAQIYSITYSLFSLFLAYSIVFGVCLWWNYRLISRFISPTVALFISIVQLGYWCIFASGQVLSENLGIILGVVSSGHLLKTFYNNILINVISTSFWLSLCLFVRPSNLFLLFIPFIFLLSKAYSRKSKIIGSLAIVFVEVLPIMVPKYLASRIGLAGYGNAGNAWSSLYGLANNNSNWNEAYSNMPLGLSDSEYSKIIRERTLDLIGNNPFGMPLSVLKNLRGMFGDGFPFFLPFSIHGGLISIFLGTLALIFILVTVLKYFKDARLHIEFRIAAIFYILSTLLFFAISWKSEPVRVSSPFIGFFFLILITCWIPRKIDNRNVRQGNVGKSLFIWILAPAMLLFLNFASLYSPTSPADVPNKCAREEFSLLERTLDFVDISKIRTTNFFSWGNDISSLRTGFLIQGLENSEGYGPKSIYAPGLSDVGSKEIAQLCFKQVDNEDLRLLKLGYTEVRFHF